jgi:hypothetical protein
MKKYSQKKSIARFRKVVIGYCREARAYEDDYGPMTLQDRVGDFLLYLKNHTIPSEEA